MDTSAVERLHSALSRAGVIVLYEAIVIALSLVDRLAISLVIGCWLETGMTKSPRT